ncbi:MAG: hypothetical protein ACLPT4_16775, partial [Verrucomicrobiia bacterium]
DGIAFCFVGTSTDLSDGAAVGDSRNFEVTVKAVGTLADQFRNSSTGQQLSAVEKEKVLFDLAMRRWLPMVKSGTAKPKEHFVLNCADVPAPDRNVANLDKLPDPTTWSRDVEVDPPRISGFGAN